MVGDDAANAAIAWLSRDSFVPILFRRSKPTYGKMTCEGVVCGIADILVATLATTQTNRDLFGLAFRDAIDAHKLESVRFGTTLKACIRCANIPLRSIFCQQKRNSDDGQLSQHLYVTHARHRRLNEQRTGPSGELPEG